MSLASYRTAPPRVSAWIIADHWGKSRAGEHNRNDAANMARMTNFTVMPTWCALQGTFFDLKPAQSTVQGAPKRIAEQNNASQKLRARALQLGN